MADGSDSNKDVSQVVVDEVSDLLKDMNMQDSEMI